MHVVVEPKGEVYRVKVEVAEDVEYDEVSGVPRPSDGAKLALHWGLHREWLDEWMCLPDLPKGSSFNDDDKSKPATRTSLRPDRDDEGEITVRHRGGFPYRFFRASFEIPAYFAPLELDFCVVAADPQSGEETFDGPRGVNAWPHGAFAVPIGMAAGTPAPLGASRVAPEADGPGWVNFALHSAQAAKITLVLQWTHGGGEAAETMEVALNPSLHRTGDVWHVALPVGMRGAMLPLPAPSSATAADDGARVVYGYKCDGDPQAGGWRYHPAQVMFDPRAALLVPPLCEFPDPQTVAPKYMGSLADVMNGGDDGQMGRAVMYGRGGKLRKFPAQEVVYELSVADFTSHLSAGVEPNSRGTYGGVLAKLDHIVSTGATTVLLHPVAASARRGEDDAWGEAPVSLFAPEPAFAAPGEGEVVHQLRELVQGLHARGLDVLVHVVLTHLGEGTDEKPMSSSLRGIDPFSYYQMAPDGSLEGAMVPGTTVLNPCLHATQRLVLDALRHWRVGLGVDGFVVNSGGGVARGHMGRSMLLEAIALDPVLGGGRGGEEKAAATAAAARKSGKAVDIPRLYLTPADHEVGHMQNWGVWGEANSAYARDVGRFMEGNVGTIGALAARVCGSADLIRAPRSAATGHVLNALAFTPHGLTLADHATLIAGRAKVDASDRYVTPEVPTGDAALQGVGPDGGVASVQAPLPGLPPVPPTAAETATMMRSMLATLFLSDGIPCVSAGDEYGHTREGSAPAPAGFGEEVNAFRWDALKEGTAGAAIKNFVAALAQFRRRRADLFCASGANVIWTNLDGWSPPNWQDPYAPPVIMCRRKAETKPPREGYVQAPSQDVVVVFNGGGDLASATVGHPPDGYAWVRVVDSSLRPPSDCSLSYVNMGGAAGTYLVSPHAVLVLELAPAPEGAPPPRRAMRQTAPEDDDQRPVATAATQAPSAPPPTSNTTEPPQEMTPPNSQMTPPPSTPPQDPSAPRGYSTSSPPSTPPPQDPSAPRGYSTSPTPSTPSPDDAADSVQRSYAEDARESVRDIEAKARAAAEEAARKRAAEEARAVAAELLEPKRQLSEDEARAQLEAAEAAMAAAIARRKAAAEALEANIRASQQKAAAARVAARLEAERRQRESGLSAADIIRKRAQELAEQARQRPPPPQTDDDENA